MYQLRQKDKVAHEPPFYYPTFLTLGQFALWLSTALRKKPS